MNWFECLQPKIYTEQQKKYEKLLLWNWSQIKYLEFKKYLLHVKLTVFYTVSFTCNIYFLNFKKYILHVKLTVFYTVSFTCNIYFLNSECFIFDQFKNNKFSRFFCCWVNLLLWLFLLRPSYQPDPGLQYASLDHVTWVLYHPELCPLDWTLTSILVEEKKLKSI